MNAPDPKTRPRGPLAAAVALSLAAGTAAAEPIEFLQRIVSDDVPGGIDFTGAWLPADRTLLVPVTPLEEDGWRLDPGCVRRVPGDRVRRRATRQSVFPRSLRRSGRAAGGRPEPALPPAGPRVR